MIKKIDVKINDKPYTINLETIDVWQYVFSRGGEESGDIEGWECVGEVIGIEKENDNDNNNK